MERVADIVEWTPATLCPCSLDANQADPTHVLCRGLGRLYLTSQIKLIRAMVSRFRADLTQSEFGTGIPGDVLVAPLIGAGAELGLGDQVRMITWQDGEPFEGELLTRPDTGGTTFLHYTPVTIERALSVSGPRIVSYVEGVDYTVAGHVITWLGPAPWTGAIVSIKYRALMEYIVVDVPQVRYERGADLGEKVLARRRHLIAPGLTAGTNGQGSFV